MSYDTWFDSDENRALMAICTRRLIRNIGIGGLVWGGLNIGIGIVAIQETLINSGLLILGVLMFASGIQALRRPSLGLLLAQTLISILMLLWNLGINLLNAAAGGKFDIQSIIFPLVIAIMFGSYYHKLGHLRDLIASVPAAKIAATREWCKTIVKKKLKDEPLIVETTDRKTRAQLMDAEAFFIQRDLMRAFVAGQDECRRAVSQPDADKWTAVFRHPLGNLKYRFDKKNTAKLKAWLAPAR